MIITKDFHRFVENAEVSELVTRKGQYEQFLNALESRGLNDYIGEVKAAIRIIDEEMVARAEVNQLKSRRSRRNVS